MVNENKKFPMNLQFFAGDQQGAQNPEEPAGADRQNPEEPAGAEQDKPEEPEVKEPTVQELMVELAKLKRAQEKAASEAAEYKRKYNEKLTEKEKLDAEKAEREAEKEQIFQETLRENKIYKLEKYYLGELKYTPDEASKMAIAEVDGDFDAKLKVQLAVDKRKKKEYETEFYKSRPPVNAGTGEGGQLTKEQFENMGLAEKSKLWKENKAEYDRLKGLK